MGIWLVQSPQVARSLELAVAMEVAGLDGLFLFDSDCLAPDCLVELSRIMAGTERLRFGTCATNVAVRHPAQLASAAATLQLESHGRMVLGVSRGDSSVAKLGMAPLKVAEFANAISVLKDLVAGEEAQWLGQDLKLDWLAGEPSDTPIWSVASGPRAVAAGAAVSDGQVIQVGADPDVIARVMATARDASSDPHLQVAAYIVVGLNEDPDVAREMARGMTLTASRMAQKTLTELGGHDAADARLAASQYSLSSHGRAGEASHDADGLIDSYAIAGTPAQCRARLAEINDAGVDDVILLLGSLDTPRDLVERSFRLLVDEVLPGLR